MEEENKELIQAIEESRSKRRLARNWKKEVSILHNKDKVEELELETDTPHHSRNSSSRRGLSGLVRKVSSKINVGKNQDPPPRRRGSRRNRRSVKRGQSIKRGRSVRRPNGAQISLDVEKGVVVKRKHPNINAFLANGCRRLLFLIGVTSGTTEEKQPEIVVEPIIEEIEAPQRYRPDNLLSLCEATGFSELEMKRMYRGFKTECPQGLVTEEVFHNIFNKFFPLGDQVFSANVSSYSHYVFSALDQQETGVITFEDFALGLAVLVKGTEEDKLRWTFNMYDLNGDGVITRDEMEDIVASIYDLMGKTGEEKPTKNYQEDDIITQRVNQVFQKMDLNGDGAVSMEEFMATCLEDRRVIQSIASCTNVII